MGLHNTAHYLKSKGRGRDTELVHMSKREIKGLQDLAKAAGGSLTINPDTGLVEAGFLEDALPVVAAAAATYFTAGAAAPYMTAALGSSMAGGIAAGALAGAGISGLTAAITGRDVGNAALMGGVGGAISGGLGAYGDANVLADATQKAAVESGTQAAAQSAVQAPAFGDFPGSLSDPTAGMAAAANTGMPPMPMTPPPPTSMAGGLNPGDVEAQMGGFYGGPAPANPYANMTNPQITAATGIQPPPPGPQTIYQQQGMLGKTGILALPAAGLLNTETESLPGEDPYVSPIKRISPNFKAYQAPRPNPYYQAQYPTYAAEGGIIAMAAGGATKQAYLPKGDAGKVVDSDANTRGLSAWEAAQYRNKKLLEKSGIKAAQIPKTGIKNLGGDFSDVAAAGGTAHLGDYSDGGRLLKGPGDGVSDDIPAMIGDKQPARLADGEFVIPARIVSELGNGSTEAGAKRLYAMMDRVQRARKKSTGKDKVAVDSKADKLLPA
jgi:hypothetical protein